MGWMGWDGIYLRQLGTLEHLAVLKIRRKAKLTFVRFFISNFSLSFVFFINFAGCLVDCFLKKVIKLFLQNCCSIENLENENFDIALFG